MFLSIMGTFNCYAQNNLKTLEEMGFENLSEIHEEGHHYLSYENNRYRYEGDALIVVLENLKLSVQTVMNKNQHIFLQNLFFLNFKYSIITELIIS